MKAEALSKVLDLLSDKGQAAHVIEGVSVGHPPTELPDLPETEAMGPPEGMPPVDTDDVPSFDPSTGLPLVAIEHAPEDVPGLDDNEAPPTDILDLLFT
jgi:hypothetical protein